MYLFSWRESSHLYTSTKKREPMVLASIKNVRQYTRPQRETMVNFESQNKFQYHLSIAVCIRKWYDTFQ